MKNATGKVKEFFGKMSRGVKIAIVLVLILAIGAVIWLNAYRASRPYTVLFTGLSQDDLTSVITYLNENGVRDFRIERNDTILVRESQEEALKAAILQQGYPTSGYSYGTYLDNVGILASDRDRQQLSKYDLQDQLKAVIRRFDNVRDAQVTIATNSNNRYILSDSEETATAAVFVEMQQGKSLTAQQATAIRNYVTHSVEGLSFSDVEITDSAGNRFSGGGESAVLSDTADLKVSLQDKINKQVRSNIMDVLSPFFGATNVSVSVFSEVDTSRTYSEAMQYLEPEWAAANRNGRGIIGTWIWDSGIVRGGNANANGTTGTSSNADLNEYVINEGDVTGEEQEIGTAGQIDYLVGTERTQRENAGGLVTDLMVAIAINRSSLEDDINTAEWIPVVARAAGISTAIQNEKIAIQVYPFFVQPVQEEPVEEVEQTLIERLGLPWWTVYAAIAGGILFIILLIIFLIIRRNIRKRKAAKAAAEAEALARAQAEAELLAKQNALAMSAPPVPPPEDGADIMGMNTERTMELRKDVRQFAEENPAIAAQMVKQWLHGDE